MKICSREVFEANLSILFHKMVHSTFICLLSSVGSQFRNPGLFEVTQATKAEDSTEQSLATANRALEVTVGSDLEGTAEVRVAIVTSGEEIETATLKGRDSVSV